MWIVNNFNRGHLFFPQANSVICRDLQVESWLHKFIIGPKGASIRVINQEYPKVGVASLIFKD